MNRFIPALRFRVLTPVYDGIMRLLMKDIRLKSRLVSMMDLTARDSVLDFGCGTGTLTMRIKQALPGSRVEGVDVDREILDLARKKALSANLAIDYTLYDGITLPYPDGAFGIVVSTYVVHHLQREDKPRLFREIFRVLRNDGRLYIMDFGIPQSWYAKVMTSITRHLEPVEDNILGRVPGYLRDAGFRRVVEIYQEGTAFGTVSVWRAEKGCIREESDLFPP